jgi:hypothetical protein
MGLQINILREISQAQKAKYYISFLTECIPQEMRQL